ncbi:uncharacterized protein LOC117190357 [Drosophila miranda]|uniref:uncharacterized protein LOC117190357 n=1 Tax=Drosophila miranda TaxID=7229 RepID=UPI00143F1AF8|nr:uncharacterized protein LOC117190357 [Drosophila miranda]
MVPVFGFCLRSWINSTFWRRGAITSVMAPISSIKPRRISSCSVLLRVSAMLPLHVSCACAMATFTPERISEGCRLHAPQRPVCHRLASVLGGYLVEESCGSFSV